jgi:isoaspartyl peptidase/L-asparaginase-like protein (Ntn-hydrolase superfamily)
MVRGPSGTPVRQAATEPVPSSPLCPFQEPAALASNKQDKKKREREKRVAQKKALDAQRLAQEAAANAAASNNSGKLFSASLTSGVANANLGKITETEIVRPRPH